MPEQQPTTIGDPIVLSDEQVDALWTGLLDGLQAPARRASAAWDALGESWAEAPHRATS